MTLFTYTRDVPFPSHNPSNDQPDMENNTNHTDDIIAVDHNSFNVLNGGFHTIIHQDPHGRVWDPVTQAFTPPVPVVAGINQVITATWTPDTPFPIAATQLFNLTGSGGVSQLTGSFATTEGYQWIGGVLVQWGIVTVAGSGSFASGTAGGTVTFKNRVPPGPSTIPFPLACFVVLTTPISNAIVQSFKPASISVRGLSNTQFSWDFNSSSTGGGLLFTGFNWIAIGN